MERDIRRARGQWRGCYAFEDIICDGDGGSSPKRTGGLKMGSTYYYYVHDSISETVNNDTDVYIVRARRRHRTLRRDDPIYYFMSIPSRATSQPPLRAGRSPTFTLP